jgi:peptidoglycan hydrolase-like protein with peptidoglycan-binding domain
MSGTKWPMKPGERGRAVRDLQERLIHLVRTGLVDADAMDNGLAEALAKEQEKQRFGKATRDAVQRVQRAHGLEPSGAIDEATAAKIDELIEQGDRPDRTVLQGTLSEGAEGDDVALAQQILVARGFFIAQSDLRKKRFDGSTADAVTSWRRAHGRPPKGVLEPEDLKILWAEGRELPRVVSGVVTLADGTPVEGVLVSAIDRDFRREQPLGRDVVTDWAGRYRITYTSGEFERAEKDSADLGVVVMTRDRKVLWRPTAADLLVQAPIEAAINVAVGARPGLVPSEFQRIGDLVRPLIDEVPFGEIASERGSDEGEFLAREIGTDLARLAHFVVAHRLSDASGIRADYFYALLREDGLFGVGPARPRAVQMPVGFGADTRAVLYEAVLLDDEVRNAAVHRAVAKRLVDPSVEDEISAATERLSNWRLEAESYVRDELPRVLLRVLDDLIDSGMASELASFAESLDINDLTMLYDRLDANGFFAPGTGPKAETRLKLAELLGFNADLIDEITLSLGIETPEDLRGLARLQRKDWTNLISGRASKVRLGGQKIDSAFARRQSSVIVRRFERAFPTVAFSAQLERRRPDAIPDHRQIVEFLDSHPGFELGTHRVIPFLRAAGEDPATVPTEMLRGVERVQRVFQLTGGEYQKAEGLLAAGYGSSAEIIAAGKTRFVADARRHAGMSATVARNVFRTAENTNLAAVIVGTNLRSLSGQLELGGVTALSDPKAAAYTAQVEKIIAEQPDLASLFGSTDACSCEECRSIYGPAAYFADVMRFLRNRLVKDTTLPPGPGTKTAKDVLFARRPDLGEIDLNCDNALIEVPHIDLVCELAESMISPDPGFTFAGAIVAGGAPVALVVAVRANGIEITDEPVIYGPYAPDRFTLRDKLATIAIDGPGPNWTLRLLRQTHGTAEERAASPEYVNAAAYTLIANGKAAFGLPFDLFHAETRSLLAGAGVDRAGLMSSLVVGGSPSAQLIAGERLGLSTAERDLIFLADVAGQPAIWATGPAAAAEMKNLDLFNRRTGLEYDDIESLIQGTYVRGPQDLFIRHIDSSCDLEAKELVNLDDAALDRIHRILRLARKTQLNPRDLDRLAVAPRLGAGDLGPGALEALGEFSRLALDLQIDVGSLITWLDVIPTAGDPSPHALLFQNAAATGPLDPALVPAAIAQNEADEAAVPGSGVRLGAVAADVALAIGSSRADLAEILDRLDDAAMFGPNPPVTFATLAAVYGRVRLARALGQKPVDLVRLERLAGIDPLASAGDLRRFVDSAKKVATIGAVPSDLEYLLARTSSDLPARDLAESSIQAFLVGLRNDLITNADANQTPFDPSLSPLEQLPAFEAQLQAQPGISPASIAALGAMIRLETPTVADATAAKAVIDSTFASLADPATIKTSIDTIRTAPSDISRAAFLELLMGAIAEEARQNAARTIAIGAVSSLLSIEGSIAASIVMGARLDIAGVPTLLLDLFTEGDIADGTVVLSAVSTPNLYRALRLAHASATLITPFKPDPDTVAYMFANASALGWLPLDGTRFETAAATVPLSDYLRLADSFALFASYPRVPRPGQPGETVGPGDVLTLAQGGGPKADVLDALAALAGWPRDRLDEADTRLGLANADYRDPETWAGIGRLVASLHALGVPIAEALAYAAPVLGDAERRNARRMLRARYQAADWLPALKAIMDPIREQKRDAVLAYLLAANPGLTNADLYDHFLTAPLWSAKMPSSRLVQAHGTLQLFIQRCMAGLEPTATAALDEDPDWSWWQWMSHFRVWQVPRQIYVDAHEYLRSEWRDDKTESFTAFESMINQNEISGENVEAAFEGYLDALDDLAFLDVLATCYDSDRSDLHVFGATKGGDPRVYYHRVMQRERSWTPWRKIDLDITGEHLVPFFRNRRLYLAWATFLEKGNDQQDSEFPTASSGSQSLPPAERHLEVRIAISEFTGKRWRPRRVSHDFIETPWTTETLDPRKLHLTVNPAPQRFTIDLYLESGWMQPLGSFLVTGCKGYPEVASQSSGWTQLLPQFKDTSFDAQRLVELGWDNDDELAMSSIFTGGSFQTLFGRTPGTFRVTYPYQQSEIDRLINALLALSYRGNNVRGREGSVSVFGTLMPYFFEDNQRGYVLVPGFYGPIDERTKKRRTSKTFSDVRRLFMDIVALITKYLQLLTQASTIKEKQAVLAQLAADPDYARILAEIDVYRRLRFGTVVYNFYHPLACYVRERFFERGVQTALARSTQLHVGPFRFEHQVTGHAPTQAILPPYPREEFEFDRIHAYSDMNMELTFHSVDFLVSKLMAAGLYDEAEPLARMVFDPLGSSDDPAPQRYWQTKPFYLRTPAEYGEQMLSSIMNRLARDPDGLIETELADSVLDWRRNPLKPYLVARSRPVAFQRSFVQKTAALYLGRGNQSFRRDQLEDLVLAELDYSRAERLLGRRPRIVPPAIETPPMTYNELASKLDLFGNALLTLENLVPDLSALPHDGAELPPLPLTLESLYFCIPPGAKLFSMWDELERNQFNLRNSRTIDGVERRLSLFAPPLSVEALIAASAAGLSISQILDSLSAPRPPYRFRVMLRHAIECADVAASFARSLQQAIASADVEGLARLKSGQEIAFLREQTVSLEKEIEAATKALENAQKAKALHQESQKFYAERPYMNPFEVGAATAYGISTGLQAVMAIGYIAAGGLALIPKFMVGAAGFGGSPTANAQTGGDVISQAARDVMVGAVSSASSALDKGGAMLEKQGGYTVRKADWDHTASIEKREIERAEIDIAVARIRQTIAKENRRLHTVKQEQATAEESYRKTMFTKQERLVDLATEGLTLSKGMFNLAREAAVAAQFCHNFELGTTDIVINAGHWRDDRRGLLAADHLITDLRTLESTHLKKNTREREITTNISLARLDPTALLELRSSGRCTVQIPEAFFDLEHPGHYFRRIKSLAVTVPAVTGPYRSIPVKVTQTANRIRTNTEQVAGGASDFDKYAEVAGGDSSRFAYNVGSIETIETSHGRSDSGLFAVSLDDDRYLPFEGSGAIGTYVLEMPQSIPPFEYWAQADVVFEMRLTARDGGGSFKALASNALREGLNAMVMKTGRVGLFESIDVRRDRPDAWHQLVTTGTTELTIELDDLPYFATRRVVSVKASRLIAKVAGGPASYSLTVGGAAVTLNDAPEPDLDGMLSSSAAGLLLGTPLSITVPLPATISEMVVLVNYEMTAALP